MKQTAVEWLDNNLKSLISEDGAIYDFKRKVVELFEQAKSMEKEQIMDAYTNALTGSIDPRWVEIHKKQAELYYNETFKSE